MSLEGFFYFSSSAAPAFLKAKLSSPEYLLCSMNTDEQANKNLLSGKSNKSSYAILDSCN
jgi:hypothetical protein